MVGSPYADPEALSGAGGAYVFVRAVGGTTWTGQAKLTASDKAAGYTFGHSVSIFGDTAVIGAQGAAAGAVSGAGAAYVLLVGKANGDACTLGSECASGACVAGTCGKSNGTACAQNHECKTSFCVDGVCCDTTCAGGTTDCQACSMAEGAAADGTCGPRTAGLSCGVANDARCEAVGTCNASSVCTLAPAANTVICNSIPNTSICRANYRCDGVTVGSCPATNPTPANSSTICSSSSISSLCVADYRCNGVTVGSCPTTNPTPANSSTICSSSSVASLCVANYRCNGVTAGSCPTTNPTPASNSTVCSFTGNPRQCALSYRCDGVTGGSCPTTNPIRTPDYTSCPGGTCLYGACRLESDLRVQLSASTLTTSQQQPVTVFVAIENTGKGAAMENLLTLILPTDAGFSVTELDGPNWTCQRANGSATCLINQIPVGVRMTVTLKVVPPITVPRFAIEATLTSATYDTDPLNNSDKVTIANSAPCAQACPPESGEQATGCQIGGSAAPSVGWPVSLGACLILLGRRRRHGRTRHNSPSDRR